jgi:cold shock CspA family protein
MTAQAHETRMQGEMLWFNEAKDFGFIASATGERIEVHGSDFGDAGSPRGRCAGRVVTFRPADDGETAKAEDVRFVDDPAPRRARIRRSGGR